MNKFSKRLSLLLPLAVSISAYSPVATLTSPEQFTLDGHLISVSGVSSWPLILGDEIVTQNASAVVTFQSGIKMEIAAHSRVKLIGSATQPKVAVESGKISTSPSKSSSASIRPDAGTGGPPPISHFQ